MPIPYNVKILTRTIGEALVDLIQNTVPVGVLKVCQYGGVERVAEVDKLGKMLDAIFIEPEGETEYREDGKLDIAGTHSEVIEHYRISIWKKYEVTENPAQQVSLLADDALFVLRSDPRLSALQATIKPNQISDSRLVAVDWTPDEQLLLVETAAAVKVIVLRWMVRWYSRG